MSPPERARVQGDHHYGGRRGGTIAWAEHLRAWEDYARRFGNSQDARRIHDRGGFSFDELTTHLGHEPTTWRPNSP